MKENKTIDTLKFVLKKAWSKKPFIIIVFICKYIGTYIWQLGWIFLPKLIIDNLVAIINGAPVETHVRNAFIIVAIIGVLRLISNMIEDLNNHLQIYYQEWFNADLEIEMADFVMRMDYEHTEDPEVLNQMNKAKEGRGWYSGGIVGILEGFFSITYNFIIIISVCIIVIKTCPLLLPVQLVALFFMILINQKKNEINVQFFLKLSKRNRIFGYVFFQLADFHFGKDIRLYDSQKMFCDKADEQANKIVDNFREQKRKELFCDCIYNTVNALRDGVSYFYIAYLAVKKIISIGDFTMCATSATTLYQGLTYCSWGVQTIIKKSAYLSEYIKFLQYPEAMKKGDKEIIGTEHVIEFKDVSFKYPRSNDYTLEHVSITIKQGDHLAVVGLNGAGKTTFIKLLCRLYDVTDGEIDIDGINIKDYSNEEYRKLLAVVFQDYRLFALTLKDNITLGNEDTDQNVMNYFKQSGLDEDIEKMPEKLETFLYKSFEEKGVELSGGQQQKTALSRALYKNAPIVILDEPTAALDPIAEADIYSHFNKLVGGKTAIYISHRLSSCKFCDKIAVFSEKSIKEFGTHDELMSIGGVYATMFNTQAAHYRENTENEENKIAE